MTSPTGFRPVVLGLLAVLLLGACSSANAPSNPSSAVGPTPSAPAPSSDPSDSAGGGASGDPGQSDPSVPVGGIVNPTPVDPGLGQPKLVIPRPGQLNPRPVGAASLEPARSEEHSLNSSHGYISYAVFCLK